METISFLKRSSDTNPYAISQKSANLNVFSILDEFTQSCFSEALNLYAVEPNNFSIDFDYVKPKLLLVESAWSGNESRWRYHIVNSKGPSVEFRRLITSCQKAGIPTVFWNKEDPVHFDVFIQAAQLFDFVYTTDGDLLPQYEKKLGRDKVRFLPFFAAPKIHNPTRVDNYRVGDVAFGGQYFSEKYPERSAQMDILFPAASQYKFSIFSRVKGGSEKYQFPERYRNNIVGSLPYLEMVNEYKRHKIFLNVNSIVSSSTMCARRVFELAATKTVIASSVTPAIRNVFTSEEIGMIDTAKEAEDFFDKFLHDKYAREVMGQKAWRNIARSHTVYDRLRQIENDIDVQILPEVKDSIALFTDFERLKEKTIRQLVKQTILTVAPLVNIYLVASDQIMQLSTDGLILRPDVNIDKASILGVLDGQADYGKYYLEDLYLRLTKFGDSSLITKPISAEDSETLVDYIQPAAWMSTASDQSRKLIDCSLKALRTGNNFVRLHDLTCYAVDRFNFKSSDAESLQMVEV